MAARPPKLTGGAEQRGQRGSGGFEGGAVDPLVGGVGQQRIARARGSPPGCRGRRSGRRRSTPAWPARRGGRSSAASSGSAGSAGRPSTASRTSTVSPSSSTGASSARTVGLGAGRVAVGGEAVVERDGGAVGHDVAGHPALDPDRLERLAVLAAVEHGAPGLEGLDEGEQAAEAVDGVAAHPGPGGVGPGAARVTARRIVPWQPASRMPSVGSPRMASVAVEEVGALAEEQLEAAVGAGDLLAGVEDVGDVDGGLASMRSARSRKTAMPPCMSDAPRPHTTSPSMRARSLSLAGTVSVWPTSSSRRGPPELGAGHHVVADPVDRQPRHRGEAPPRGGRRSARSS